MYKYRYAWPQGIGLGCVQAEREVRVLKFETSTTQANILDECLAFLASGSDPTVPSLEALNEAL